MEWLTAQYFLKSTLGKKHNAVNDHVLRDTPASEIMRVEKEDTKNILDYLLTNTLGWQQRHKLLIFILYSR